MMPTMSDIRQNLSGAWALFRSDADGLNQMDTSFRGFWLSFMAIVLLIPVFAVYLAGEQYLIELSGEDYGVSTGSFLATRAITFVIDWIAFPILMILIVALLDRRSRYVPFVVAYNWGGVIIALLVAIPTVFFTAGMMPVGVFQVLTLITLIIALRYLYIIARVALFADRLTAAGIVAADTALSLVLSEISSRIFGF